jgi:hypothetical protein
MTHKENRFTCRWTGIDTFELVDNGAQIAIVMRLRDGSRQLLPSTRAWFWDKGKVNQTLDAFAENKRQHNRTRPLASGLTLWATCSASAHRSNQEGVRLTV